MLRPFIVAALVGLGALGLAAQDEAAPAEKLVELSPKVHRTWKFRLPAESWAVVGTKIDLEDSLGKSFATRRNATALEVDVDGDGTFDVKVQGQTGFVVLKGETGRYALRLRNQGRWELAPSSSMQGKIDGVRVRVFDLDGNGRFDDYGTDAMVVGNGKSGSFLSRVITMPDGSLREIEVAPHGRSLLVRPYGGDAGKLALDWETRGKVLRAVLNSPDGRYSFEVGHLMGTTVTLPEAEYVLHSALVGMSDRRVSVDTGKAKGVTVDGGQPARIALGGPVTAEFGYARRGRDYRFDPYDIAYFGQGGERYYAWAPDGKSPRIVVRARKTGREIAQSWFPGSG